MIEHRLLQDRHTLPVSFEVLLGIFVWSTCNWMCLENERDNLWGSVLVYELRLCVDPADSSEQSPCQLPPSASATVLSSRVKDIQLQV